MNICPICDKKITGKWCKNCFRFVEPIEVADGILINESHSVRDDSNCEYHNPKVQYDNQGYMKPKYENKVYRSSEQQKKSGIKAVKIIVWVYVLFVFIGIGAAVISNSATDEFDEIYLSDGYDEYEVDYTDEKELYENSDEELKEILKELTPIDTEITDRGETYYYFKPEDVKVLENACDYVHMDITSKELIDEIIPSVCPGIEFDVEEYSDEYYNLYVEFAPGSGYLQFETQYDMNSENIMVCASADTVTDELHYYFFMAEGVTDEFCEVVYNWCDSYASGEFNSVEDVKSYYNDVVKESTYETHTTEFNTISFMTDGVYTYFYVEPLYE